MNILEAKSVSKTYKIEDRQLCVLDNVSLAIEGGEFAVIQGSSGSGKSTLLSLLSGLDSPSTGRIIVAGQDITDWSEDQLAPLRNTTIGFVFQSFHLIPSLSALENVMFPAELRQDRQRAEKGRSFAGSRRAPRVPGELSPPTFRWRKTARGDLPRPGQRSADSLRR